MTKPETETSKSSFDWVALPCGCRLPDMSSPRTVAALKAEPDFIGLNSLFEYAAADRFERKEHAAHELGACAK